MFGLTKKKAARGISTSSQSSAEKKVTSRSGLGCLYFEDVNNPHWKVEKVGNKGLSLMNLIKSNIPVPPFFVVTTDVFDEFVYTAFQNKLPELIKNEKMPDPLDIKRMFKRTTFLETTQKEIDSFYSRLSGLSSVWVSVRSSVVYDDPNVNFSGIFDTVLGVKGIENVFQAIKDVYYSAFTDRVLAFAKQNNVDLTKVRLAVVVQEMKPSEISGEMYTVDPVLMDSKYLSIEAVYGLSSVITNGEITPDRYVVDKLEFNIKEKNISPQEWMLVQALSNKSRYCSIDKVSISPQWSYVQKVEDFNIQELAKLGSAIEQIFNGAPQDITWVLSNGNFWVLQSKPIKGMVQPSFEKASSVSVFPTPSVPLDTVAGVTNDIKENVEEQISKSSEESKEVQQEIKELESNAKQLEKLLDQSHAKIIKEVKKEERVVKRELSSLGELDEANFRLVADAIGASYGQFIGKSVLLDGNKDKTFTIDKGKVLVIKSANKNVDVPTLVLNAGAVVMVDGSLTCDIAVIAREVGIPIVVNVGDSITKINEGDLVKVDGGSGGIYVYKDDAEFQQELPSWIDTKEVSSSEKEVHSTVPVLSESDVPVTATKVYIYPTSKANLKNVAKVIDGVMFVDLDQILLKQEEHILHAVETKSLRPFISKVASEIDAIADIVNPKEVVVTIGSASGSNFKKFNDATKFESSTDVSGASRYAQNPKMAAAVFKIIRQLRNVFKDRNVSLGVLTPTNGDIMREIKLLLSSASLKRTRSFNLYAVLTKSSEVLLIDDIAKVGLDGFIIHVPLLAMDMQGGSSNLDLHSKGIMISLKTVFEKTKEVSMPTLVVCEDDIELAKSVVEMGAVGVCTTVETFVEVKKVIADQEAELILRVK